MSVYKTKERTRPRLTLVAATLWLLLVSVGCAKTVPPSDTPAKSHQVEAVQAAQVEEELSSFARLAGDLKPYVVHIKVTKRQSGSEFSPGRPFERFFNVPGADRERLVSGQGSGFILTSDGEILTNHHVVAGAEEIDVILSDRRTLKAELKGYDESTDLALLKVEATGLPSVSLGDSDKIRVGDWVMAIGNPFGLEATVTVGVLSGKGRVIGQGPYDDFLQTDASINPGNSGGPLFNLKGEVVGINTAIIAGGQGIGFAVPVDMAKDVLAQLRHRGHVVRGFVGLGIQPLTPELRQSLGVPEGVEGALIGQVMPNGPSADSGIQPGDVVVEVAGVSVNSDRELLQQVAKLPVGEKAELTAYRGNRRKTFTVTVAQRPGGDQAQTPPAVQKQRLGLELRALSPDLAQRLRLPVEEGVVVTQVSPGSAADRAGLQQGDVILQVSGRKVGNAEEFWTAFESQAPAALLVQRGNSSMFVVMSKN